MPKFLLPLIAAGLVLATAATAQAAETRSTPGWLKADPASRTVEMDVVSGFNENNNVWNFNGFHTGDATILVPLGWEVRMLFSNKDDAVPHSLVVIADPGEESEYPLEAGEEAAALHGAHSSKPLEGIEADKPADTMAFKAEKAGDYLIYCGVAGHGQSGMWVRMKVDEGLDAPALAVAEGAEPGRG